MRGIKELLIDIQDRLQESIPKLWTDKDWGQLQYPQPPVKFPCVLIDIERVDFSSLERDGQIAEVDIFLTIANRRLKASSVKAPDRRDGYHLLDVLESVHKALQLYHAGWYAPLLRKSMSKVYIDNTIEVYSVVYSTSFKQPNDEGEKLFPSIVKVDINI